MSTATLVRPEPISGPSGSPFMATAQLPDPFTLVIFGANGDLSARKLMPAIYGLWHRRFLPQQFAVVGLGRKDKTDEAFREDVRNDIVTFRHDVPAENDWNDFLGSMFYPSGKVAFTMAMIPLRMTGGSLGHAATRSSRSGRGLSFELDREL